MKSQGDSMTLSPDGRTAVTEWIKEMAHPLTTADPSAPLDDLRPLLSMLGDGASVVGCGAGTRGAHEILALQARLARLLVVEAGFRAVVLDQDWTLGVGLDEFVRTGTGDPEALLARAEPFSRTEEVLELLEWMRTFNMAHPGDPVRFVGVSPHEVRGSAYDTVVDFVRRAAPDRVAELEACYAGLRPGDDVRSHTRRFRDLPARTVWVDRARAAHALVAGVPAERDGHAWAVQNARLIVQYYELHDHDQQPLDPHNMAQFERFFAENLAWWHEHTGHKALFWSSSSHTSNGSGRAMSFPPNPVRVSRNAGSYLRDRFGPRYTSIGLTFDHGELATHGDAPPHQVPNATPPFAESVLSASGISAFLLDLGGTPPPPVAEWLDEISRLRAIGPRYDPDNDAAHHMTGGSLAEWFDIVVHCRRVTPARPIRNTGRRAAVLR
ncbi:erythromycin esterase [Streptomyces abyssalis]|uniref:Erythromycin esterase n=2 Tax=Streptomyces abyssalis TaxID=933944 RepID=A0A1E7JGQ6_9ACTN|nr:erythromycin esterase [Streptomyces abyssalis]OEU92905.1 erythromycin esterase [Streptomyces abyssalis]